MASECYQMRGHTEVTFDEESGQWDLWQVLPEGTHVHLFFVLNTNKDDYIEPVPCEPGDEADG